MADLRSMLAEARAAGGLRDIARVLSEIAAYVMQTGPRGGKFYFTPKGRKVYRTLRKRKRQLTGDDYDRAWAAAGNPEVGQALRAMFGDNAPSPEHLATMFDAEGITARFESASRAYGGGVKVRYKARDADGAEIGTITRTFGKKSDGTLYAHHDFFALHEDAQGGGRAGCLFGRALEEYRRLGITRVEVDAGLDAGPYVWARFGFQPSPREMEELKGDFGEFLQRPPIGLSRAQARKAASRCKDIHGLSGVQITVTQPDLETGKPVKRKIKAGRDFLLYGSNGTTMGWSGVADLEDPKALARWRRQSAKGKKHRRADIAAGRANARDGVTKQDHEVLKQIGSGAARPGYYGRGTVDALARKGLVETRGGSVALTPKGEAAAAKEALRVAHQQSYTVRGRESIAARWDELRSGRSP